MRICLASQTFAPQPEGGAEVFARRIAAHLAQDHGVTVLSLALPGGSDPAVGRTEDPAGYSVLRVPFRNKYLPAAVAPPAGRAAKALWHLRTARGAVSATDLGRVFAEDRPDLVYAQNAARMEPALFAAARRAGIPVVQHLHDYAHLCPRASMYRTGRNCARPCAGCTVLTRNARAAMGAVGTVIAVSDFVRRRHLAHGLFADADWHVVRNAVDAGAPPPPRPEGAPLTFGYLGNLSDEKGLGDLISAFRALPRDPRSRLIVGGAGDTQFQRRMRDLAGNAPVEFLGRVDRTAFFAEADVVVVPSRWHEPCALVVLEAAAHGRPVIASDRGGTPEIVDPRQTGWLYDPDAPGALGGLLRRALDIGPDTLARELPRLFPGLNPVRVGGGTQAMYRAIETILTTAAEAPHARP